MGEQPQLLLIILLAVARLILGIYFLSGHWVSGLCHRKKSLRLVPPVCASSIVDICLLPQFKNKQNKKPKKTQQTNHNART